MDRLPWAHGHQRKAIEEREKSSSLAACWTSELGGLNTFVHTWVYKDLNERARVREGSRKSGGQWPPRTGVWPIWQENKLLVRRPSHRCDSRPA
jgi:hypothetical protein